VKLLRSYGAVRSWGWGVVAVGLATFAVPARAITITAIYDSSITSDPNAAAIESTINQVVSFYDLTLTTPITVEIDFQEMFSGLGQSSTFVGQITYDQYLAALQAHSSGDAVDTIALASLPAGPNNPVNGDTRVDVTTANLRALGFSANPPGGQADSTISINTSITNYGGSSNPSFYSLAAVVEHELDEALGLGSNLDTGSTSGAIRPEDLFRYASPGVRSYTTSSGATAYFSLDGGVTNLINFNQVGPPGGSDYGDWAGSGTPHVQDAFGTPGSNPVPGVELTALDAIGYNEVNPVPEPASFWLVGLGTVCFLIRRRRA
jgi:hypothetical protein